MAGTIYEKYGGFKTVSRIVMAFYDKALDSDQIGDYFVDVNLSQLIDHQTKFISSLLGGPVSFSDDQLHRVHRQLEICHADFDEMVSLLSGTLVDHGMARDDVETVISEIEARRKVIVSIGS